jgi:ER protein Pkr1
MSSSQVEYQESFLSDILKPGSSTNPTFLFIVDCVLGSLLVVLLSLSYLTSGNFHIFALTAIELALWASIKWCVQRLRLIFEFPISIYNSIDTLGLLTS